MHAKACYERIIQPGVSMSSMERETACDTALRESQERIHHALTAARVLFWDWDIATKRVSYSSDLYAYFGMPGESQATDAETAIRVVHPADRDHLAQASRLTIETGVDFKVEFRGAPEAGENRWYEAHGRLIRDDTGQAVRLTGIVIEVTETKRAEFAHRQTELRFTQVTEQLPQVFWMTDWPSQGIEFVNSAFEEIWGRSVESLLRDKRTWIEGIHPEDRERVLAMDRAPDYPEGYDVLYRVLRPDGTVRWVRDRAYPIRDESERVVRVAGLCEDITERRHLEETLERERRLFLEGPAVIFRWVNAPGWPVEYVSENIREFGYTPEEFVTGGRSYASIVHPDDLVVLSNKVAASIASGGTRGGFSHRIFARDGSIRWLEDYTVIRRDSTGRATHLDGYVIDSTPRRSAEEKERISDRRFRLLFEMALDPIQIVDQHGVIVDANPAACELHQMTRSELIGMNVLTDYQTPPGVATAAELFRRHKETGSSVGRFEFIRRDGSRRVTLYAAKDLDDGLLVAYLRDITERERHERALLASEEKARQSARSIQRLLDEVNHRVKNNLSGLINLVGLAERAATDKSELARGLVERLRAMHTAHVILVNTPGSTLSLHSLIRQIERLTWNPHGTNRLIHLAGPDVSIMPEQVGPLAMVVNELLTNSMKYGAHHMPEGRIEFSWEEPVRTKGSRVLQMIWAESGGPEILHPPKAGLGVSLIEGFARFELQGSAKFDFRREGLVCRITMCLAEEAKPSFLSPANAGQI